MTSRLDSLQALRGVACLLVVWCHVGYWEQFYGLHTPVVGDGRSFGTAGVDLFFVLSGFLIAHTQGKYAGRPAAVPAYLALRAWRIYPTYWVVLGLVTAAAGRLAGWAPISAEAADWLTWATLLPSRTPNMPVGQAWTLTYEVMFYLAFAAVIALPRRLGWWLLAGWGVAVGVAAPGWSSDHEPYHRTALSPLVLEFLAGAAVAVFVGRGARWGGAAAVAAGVGYTVVVAGVMAALTREDLCLTLAHEPTRVVVFGPAAVLVVYGAAVWDQTGRRPAPGWLRATGDASYSIYLWHGVVGMPAVMLGCYVPHDRLPHLAWLAATTTVAVGGGFVLHRLVERPLLRLGSKPQPGQRPAAST